MDALIVAGVTMTSLEMLDYINAERAEGETELRHDHFIAKVTQVLGKTGAPKFRGTYRDVQNKERPCYRFPKREACLMAMSYSYELQAKVFDKMTALEALVARPVSMSRMDILKLAMESEQRAIDAEASRDLAIASLRDLMATLKLAGT